MNFNEVNYNEIFTRAKDITVYGHAMVWINEVIKEKTKTDTEKFLEIHRIVIEAVNHISDDE